ncbi:hypothetical protein PoB_005138400 [Plakobranchus ocellatus]|uniref:Uncharacterized protein n=1 Tax=Plakobranchus ocellatus TaxID=259542 RepID=A0AAV4C171_9GAST|nr:hypothetical protein PoB_005138400 [Plakobranchus ocellatus]
MGDCKGAGQNPIALLWRAIDAAMFTPDCSATNISRWTPTIALTGSWETVLAAAVALTEVVREDVADYIGCNAYDRSSVTMLFPHSATLPSSSTADLLIS